MDYKKVLEKLGLVEGVDFALTIESFEMLPKNRQVEQIVSHPEVLEVTEEQEILDEDGLSYDPRQFETVVITPYQAAYDEVILVDEQYVPEAPSMEIMEAAHKEVILDESDIALLVEEYLSDKAALRDSEDSLNIVNNRIHSWGLINIPQPSIDELVAISSIVLAKKQIDTNKNAKLQAGKKARETCLKCLDIIAGYNLEQELTAEQITEMQTTFAPIQTALMTARPSTAKALITALTPDEILVTQELKDLVLSELAEY